LRSRLAQGYAAPVRVLCIKRALDLAGAGIGLVVAAPVLLGVAAAVRRDLGSPVVFRQRRIGKDGAIFTLWKFRTMRDERDGSGRLRPDGERLTALGRWLRSTSLDELPQLYNVLRGEMSLVGPRPLLPEYLPRYSAAQARRHQVKPGITGWAQIKGRNALTWESKFALDVWYVDHESLWLDARILWVTIAKVVARSGVSAAGEATMTEFLGSAGPHSGQVAASEHNGQARG
jgi:lipopolysaccharide/colanic/teichoic acid biosynthesis glycosyltransferase